MSDMGVLVLVVLVNLTASVTNGMIWWTGGFAFNLWVSGFCAAAVLAVLLGGCARR